MSLQKLKPVLQVADKIRTVLTCTQKTWKTVDIFTTRFLIWTETDYQADRMLIGIMDFTQRKRKFKYRHPLKLLLAWTLHF